MSNYNEDDDKEIWEAEDMTKTVIDDDSNMSNLRHYNTLEEDELRDELALRQERLEEDQAERDKVAFILMNLKKKQKSKKKEIKKERKYTHMRGKTKKRRKKYKSHKKKKISRRGKK